MNELELLNAIAAGRNAFCRATYPDFDSIDRHLRSFAERGYVVRIVRAIHTHDGEAQAQRADVIGGLTPIGEMRRGELSRESQAASSNR